MKVILVPGFWFDASSWDAVTPLLQQSGHDVTALTLPGLASVDIDRSDIGLAEHVAAVVEQVDAAGEPVVLVGSSFAGKLVQIVTDERPESVALVVYVDSLPKPVDAEAADEPAGADIAFSWDELTPDEQRDLTPDQRSTIERTAVPYPARVVRDGWVMADDRRYAVRSLVVATGFTSTDLEQWRADYPGVGDELDAHTDLTIVELPTSHWPQITTPHELVETILDAMP
ncbi:alpha/beta fold hydrolase [Aeromicrobium stalagmiti]|uniref:alpha/beta fold hydrolase n=1 Tax=Aeromicrobium stalagmiti TaxID=2738988 RepID=UPI00156A59E8|nr:alpha/beta fold hydrolase [Aeromicrobium stalagmiti]NRQ50969.1 alpha/beta fold hydrolase [Aeromicrobium stalagmiti]